MKVTNNSGLHLYTAMGLLYSDYDHITDANYISATKLLRPLKMLLLTQIASVNGIESELDVSDLVKSFAGSAVHTAIEYAWSKKSIRDPLLAKLGKSKKYIKRILVNPTKKDLKKFKKKYPKLKPIIVITEKRAILKIGKYRIGGKCDVIFNGELGDVKNTSTFKYSKIMQEKTDYDLIVQEPNNYKTLKQIEDYCPSHFEWIMQLSIYRLLHGKRVSHNTGNIQNIFSDRKSSSPFPDYPDYATHTYYFRLFSKKATKTWIKAKLKKYDYLLKTATSEADLPECTSNELWASTPVFKVFNNDNKRATKVCKTYAEAAEFAKKKPTYHVKEVRSVSRCNFCPARQVCTQADYLESVGVLKPKV